MKNLNHWHSEKGTTVAEFAIVALLFFTVIFGIIEFGRLLYTHNALTDATRRGARFATLNRGTAAEAVKNEVVYGSKAIFEDGKPTTSPLINGLTTDMVQVEYLGIPLDEEGEMSGYGTNLGTATVRIEGYTFDLLIPVIGRQLTLPAYSTTLTAESAGETPSPINVNAP